MEFPILFKNVSESNANFYIEDERKSKIIGFVDPVNSSDKFGYILAGGKQYGASYNDIVKIAKENGGTTIEADAEKSSFIGNGGVKYTINISDGKLTVSQYLPTVVSNKTSSVSVTTSCDGGRTTGNKSTNLCVGEKYYYHLKITPNENQTLSYTITNTTGNEFVITGIKFNGNNSYAYGGAGTISDGVFSFGSDNAAHNPVEYRHDSIPNGSITLNNNNDSERTYRLTTLQSADYLTIGETLTGGNVSKNINLSQKQFTIYVHEKGLNKFTTATLTLNYANNVTYTVNSFQNYYYTAGDITVGASNKITISNTSNSNIGMTKLAYNEHYNNKKPDKFTIEITSESANSPKFLYPKSWGTPTFKQLGATDTTWQIKDGIYSVSTSKGSAFYADYKYAYYDGTLPVGSDGSWDITW